MDMVTSFIEKGCGFIGVVPDIYKVTCISEAD